MQIKQLIAFSFYLFTFCASATSLVQHFEHPAEQHKPWAFWYWINGNVTAEGIRADLTSMADAGLGGVVLMHINEHNVIPQGPVRFLSAEYRSLLKLTFKTAAELGLKVNLYNSEGWSVAGGPWVTPELGMKELSWSEIHTTVAGQAIQFPPPHSPLGFYKDITTLAFPTPQAFIEPEFSSLVSKITVSGQKPIKPERASRAIDGDWNSQVSPTVDPDSGETYIKLDFKQEYTFSNAFVKFAAYGMMGRNYLMVSDDGENYRQVAFSNRGQIYDDISCFQFEPVTTRHAKIVFKPTDNKLLYTAMPKVKVSVREIILDNRPRLDNWCQKAAHSFPFFTPAAERNTFENTTHTGTSIALDSIIDVSQYLTEDGKLNWVPPSDNWTVVRFGMSSTEAINRPGSEGGEGLEVDKLSELALDVHFANYLARAVDLAGEHTGTSLVSTHADSWEVGRQNWTQGFTQDFAEKRGYSPIRYLPATLGYRVDNSETSERFLWDLRKTLADLIAERFYGGMQKRANAMGIQFSAQSMKPFIDNLYALGQADIIYANSSFRSLNPQDNKSNQEFAYLTAKMSASAGSIYGKPVRSESFTSLPQANRWLSHPLTYKSQADTDFAAGVTLVTHHLFTHQPWTNLQPGMTLGYWGLHFERTQTWWHEINAWNDYVTRAQAVLSQGQPVFDVLHLLGDDSATKFDQTFVNETLPEGHDFEFISAHGLLNKLSVNTNNNLAYDTGREYRVLSLADDVSMRPAVLRIIQMLLSQGAFIVGKAPEFSPSLTNAARADLKVKQLVKEIWHGQYADQIFNTLPEAFAALGIQPDVTVSGTENRFIWRHHYLNNGDLDVYFVSNLEHQKADVTLDLRVSGKIPELWDPMTGQRLRITDYAEHSGRTQINLTFEQAQSFFLVFANQPTTQQTLSTEKLALVQSVTSPWRVEFIKGAQQPEPITLNNLIDLKDHSTDDVKFFSGTARYQTEFSFTGKTDGKDTYWLDLGEAHQFARVTLNGHDLGVKMWAPYLFEVGSHLSTGINRLEVEVTNLWPNRLIGDEREYPDTASWKKNGFQGFQLTDFPGWLKGATPQQPGQRNTFATWKHWSKDDALLPSGLIGPVQLFKRKADNQ
ncbi:glycoside hydrolase [Alteromonas aestuariivivens]|uniref:Glycoside hydrolase n=1 Tax=Alteromonas aestuariivivens TaxID=1938339 RepID=A0A3D8MAI8_9ALTE|nr:glycosyl hydrolase [Alteromonas aestuariivivens]RDV27374.1 glycoside hydrolase [Alteromonas aestuariivivens]